MIQSDERGVGQLPASWQNALTPRLWTFRVCSNSMGPALLPGDVVEVASGLPGELDEDELLIVRRGEALLCHRFCRTIEQNGEIYLVTQADGDSAEDPPVPLQEVFGYVVGVRRTSAPVRFYWRTRWALSGQKAKAAGLLSAAKTPTKAAGPKN